MDYQNPKIPEGINAGRENPLKEFAILTTGILGLLVVLVWALGWMAQWAAPHVPFSYEQKLARRFVSDEALSPSDERIQRWLRGIAANLAEAEDLPPGMSITVHYRDDDIVNAFATLGGHIIIYRGLLEKLHSENAVAMVLAHEIAHVKHRDPIIATGRGMSILLVLTALTGGVGDELADRVLGKAATITSLGFSRDQEAAADAEGLAALYRRYGHVAGATALFETLLRSEEGMRVPEFMRTHPDTERRIGAIRQMARSRGWPMRGALKPLPDFLPRSQGA